MFSSTQNIDSIIINNIAVHMIIHFVPQCQSHVQQATLLTGDTTVRHCHDSIRSGNYPSHCQMLHDVRNHSDKCIVTTIGINYRYSQISITKWLCMRGQAVFGVASQCEQCLFPHSCRSLITGRHIRLKKKLQF